METLEKIKEKKQRQLCGDDFKMHGNDGQANKSKFCLQIETLKHFFTYTHACISVWLPKIDGPKKKSITYESISFRFRSIEQ